MKIGLRRQTFFTIVSICVVLIVDPAGRQVPTAAVDLKKKETAMLPEGIWDRSNVWLAPEPVSIEFDFPVDRPRHIV